MFASELEVFTVSTEMDEVAKVPWPRLSRRLVPLIKSVPPIFRFPVEVPFVNVMFANDEDVLTVRTEMDEVAKVPWPRLSSLVVPPVRNEPPIFKFPVEVPFVKVMFASDDETCEVMAPVKVDVPETVSEEMVEVASVA